MDGADFINTIRGKNKVSGSVSCFFCSTAIAATGAVHSYAERAVDGKCVLCVFFVCVDYLHVDKISAPQSSGHQLDEYKLFVPFLMRLF